MKWVAVITFLLGLALGYLFGAAGEPAVSRRGERSAGPRSADPAPSLAANRTGKRSLHDGDGSRTPGPDPSNADIGDSRPIADGQLPPDRGRLVVHVAGPIGSTPDWFELVTTDMRGDPATEALEVAGEGVFQIDAFAGAYVLQWEVDGKETRIGVDIRAGEVRSLRLGNDRTHEHLPAPVPPGFGRLTVRLLGVGGAPLPYVDFFIVGRGISREEVEGLQTDSGGTRSVLLRPRTYEVRVGGETRSVTLREGEETVCTCDHSRHGEIHMPDPFPGTVKLRRPASVEGDRLYAAESNAGGVRHWVFVTPGTYEYGILLSGQRGHGWGGGTVQVMAGRATRISPPLPTGGVTVEVELEPTAAIRKHGSIEAYFLLGDDEARTSVLLRLRAVPDRPGIFRGTATHLAPGAWVFSIRLDEYIPFRRIVTVGAEQGVERVRLVRKS